MYPPLKRSFASSVRIVAYVLVAYRKFKMGMIVARSTKNLPVSDMSTVESVELPAPKFSIFTATKSNKSELFGKRCQCCVSVRCQKCQIR